MASEYENGAFLPHSVRRSMDGCLEELENLRFVDRIWHQDETLWDSNRAETRQRLGWLDAPTTMLASEDSWKSFQSELLSAGFRHAVLLGMGGSSLGAEVLNRVVAAGAEQIRLHVLDSTLPESVRAVVSSVDMSRTLFIVSSKSGSTVEPNLLYDYFRGAVEEASGAAQAGGHFIAITDPGTSLERMAGTHGFRRVFTNPANIGGRYSVLSLFGLVPGAVLGINNRLLLENAVKMSEQCGPDESGVKNPGVELAAYMVGCQRVGRDKLTLVTSPRVANFGLWAEQLIAESTGKEGTGIVPVVAEPFLSPESYATDRAFVYLRLDGDDNEDSDSHIGAIEDEGLPCVTIHLSDAYAIAGEFFKWQFATAAAGCLLGINPFDQPDVQSAKDATNRVLRHHEEHGTLPDAPETQSGHAIVDSFSAGAYLAIMAYVRETDASNAAFAEFRRRIGERHCICTTLGYGPRFLHSTGQLHKGGPDTGSFLQVVSAHDDDVRIPGHPYTFGTVVDAQALGDLEALKTLGRNVARVTLPDDGEQSLAGALRALA